MLELNGSGTDYKFECLSSIDLYKYERLISLRFLFNQVATS